MRTVLILATLCLHAAAAHANECNAYSPHTSTRDIPLGCPLLIVIPPNYPFQPVVTTTRYDVHTGHPTTIDVTGAITQDPAIQVLVDESHYVGCDLIDEGPQPQTFNEVEVTLHDVAIDDVIDVGTYDPSPHIVAAGPCPAFAAPTLACADPIMGCADGGIGVDPVSPPNHGGGCDAGGRSSGIGMALALLALVRRRVTR